MRIRNMNDCITGTVLLLLSAFLFHETWFFREVHSFSFGPRVFPRIILGITGICAFVLLLQNLSFGEKATGERQKVKGNANFSVFGIRLGLIALLSLYATALPLVGYLPCTIAFLFLTMLFLGIRKPKAVLLYAVVSSVFACALFYIFSTLLRFFLP